MSIENWSDEIILVQLQKEPDLGEELQAVSEIVRNRTDCNVVVDFSGVDILTSSSIAKLLRLRKALHNNGRELRLSSVGPQTRSIFAITGLEPVFSFADDQFTALAGLQLSGQNYPAESTS
jgi:anti-anti-sigma factor